MMNWSVGKEESGTSSILIEGARRVGKSTIAEVFAKENYKSYLLIDFRNSSNEIKNNFMRMLTRKISIVFNAYLSLLRLSFILANP